MANKFCTNCGTKIKDNMNYCVNCGASVNEENTKPQIIEKTNKSIKKTKKLKTEKTDDTQVWEYTMPIFKDISPVITLAKIFFVIFSIMVFLILLLTFFEGDLNGEVVLEYLRVFGLIYIFIILLVFISYFGVMGIIHGGKYHIIYELDEKGIIYIVAKKTMDKAERLAMIGILAGSAAGNVTTTGSSMLAGARSSMYTSFKSVTKVVVLEKKKKILLTESHLAKNEIYFLNNNYEYLKPFIIEKCKKAKIVYK